MHSPVHNQLTTLCKFLFAYITRVRFFARVRSFVQPQLAALHKLFATHRARERLVAVVDFHVRVETSPTVKCFEAARDLAGIFLLLTLAHQGCRSNVSTLRYHLVEVLNLLKYKITYEIILHLYSLGA